MIRPQVFLDKKIDTMPFSRRRGEFRKFYQPFGYHKPEAGDGGAKGGGRRRLVEINAHTRGIVRVTAAAPLGYQ